MEWIKVTEQLPERGDIVLGFNEDIEFGPYFILEFFTETYWYVVNDTYPNSSNYPHNFKPTHWIPLTEPPRSE